TLARDITERRAQHEKIERLNRVYAMLSGINAAIVHIRDRDELFRECCRIAHEAGGFDAVSIHLIDPQKLIAEPVAWHGRQEMMEWLRQGRFSVGVEKSAAQSLPVELIKTRRPATTNDALHDPRAQFKDALARFGINSVAFLPLIVSDRVTGVMTMYSPLKGHFDEAEIRLLSGLAADISFAVEHLEKSERAAYLALYDELTGLANRQLLAERLGQFIHVARHAQARLALALLDIERLRSVNNSLGRRAGDALLRQVSERLARAAGATATARVASNHFAVVLPAVRDRPDAGRKMATLTRACFAEPYTVDGTELKVRARTGLVVFPTDGADTETLLVNAETALRKAKQTGERQVFYTPDLSERTAAGSSRASRRCASQSTFPRFSCGSRISFRPSHRRSRKVSLPRESIWSSPRASSWTTSRKTSANSTMCATSACGSPSTTSAPVTPPSGISRSCRFRHSRSTVPSSSLS